MNVVSLLKRRHDWIGRRIHWEVCRQYNVRVLDKSHEHLPQRVIENEQIEVLWDFNIQTDRVIEARRPDLVIIDKEKKQVHIVEFAVPFNSGGSRVRQNKLWQLSFKFKITL